MAVGGREQLGVVHVACGEGVVVDALVEQAAALHDILIVSMITVEGVKDGGAAVTCPVALVTVEHILDVVYLVVAYHHIALGSRDLTQVAHIGEGGHIVALAAYHLGLGREQGTLAYEGGHHSGALAQAHGTIDGGHVEVAPVNAHSIALGGKDGLVYGACLDIVHAIVGLKGRPRGLGLLELGHHGVGAHEELHIVGLAVSGCHAVGDVAHWGGKQLEVVVEHGRGEDHVELDGAALEGVVGAGGEHADRGLARLAYLLEHRGSVAVEAEVGQCALGAIVSVHGNEVFALVQQPLHVGSERDAGAVSIALLAAHLGAVDEEGAIVVVRPDDIEVAGELVGSERDGATYVDIAVVAGPERAHGEVFLGAKGGLALLPCCVIESGLLPSVGRSVGGVAALPFGVFGIGRHHVEQLLGGGSHEAVYLSVYAQQTFEGLLSGRPVGDVAVVEVVVGRPEGEVRVIGDERNGRQAQRSLAIGLIEVVGLGVNQECGEKRHQ